MTLFSGAWYLFKTEVKRSPLGTASLLGILFFTLLLCSPTYATILGSYHPSTGGLRDYFISDYMFMLTFGSAGVIATFIYSANFKHDILADRLAYYRSLPIRSEHIALSKVIASLLVTLILLLVFLVGNIVGFLVFSDLQLSNITIEYVIHGIMLYGVLMVTNNLFVWIECSLSYKIYTLLSFVFVVFMFVIPLTLSILIDDYSSFILLSYRLSEAKPFVAIMIGFALTVVSCYLGYITAVRGLNKRNLG